MNKQGAAGHGAKVCAECKKVGVCDQPLCYTCHMRVRKAGQATCENGEAQQSLAAFAFEWAKWEAETMPAFVSLWWEGQRSELRTPKPPKVAPASALKSKPVVIFPAIVTPRGNALRVAHGVAVPGYSLRELVMGGASVPGEAT